MALLEIRTYPDPVLREECQPVTTFDEALKTLAEDMAETMYANDGIGLAAPQVGVLNSFLVVDPASPEDRGKAVLALANPQITESDGTIEFYSRIGLAFSGLDHIAKEICDLLSFKFIIFI